MIESFDLLKGRFEAQDKFLSSVRDDCRKNYADIKKINEQLEKMQKSKPLPGKSTVYERRFVDEYRSEFLPGEVVWGIKESEAVELVITGVSAAYVGNKKHIYHLKNKSGKGDGLIADEHEIFRTKEELIRKIAGDGK
jgi:hypothetical protein